MRPFIRYLLVAILTTGVVWTGASAEAVPPPHQTTLAPPAPRATAAPASVIVSAAQGSDWWYAFVLNSSGTPRTVIRLRYSWSWQWRLYNNYNTISTVVAIGCTPFGPVVATGCAAFVSAQYFVMRSVLASALHNRKCLEIQFPAPPLVDATVAGIFQVPCRI